MKTINDLYIEALAIQNACNLCGLAQRFAKMMQELNVLVPAGTEDRNQHLIVTLWLDKFMSLNGCQDNNKKITEAYSTAFSIEENNVQK